MSRKPLRWRIAETFEGRNGAKVILIIGAVVFVIFVVPLAFRPFEGRAADPEINQSAIECDPPISEITRSIPEGTSPNNPLRVCVERARGRVAFASVLTFFILFFTIVALLARAGKIQPREPAR